MADNGDLANWPRLSETTRMQFDPEAENSPRPSPNSPPEVPDIDNYMSVEQVNLNLDSSFVTEIPKFISRAINEGTNLLIECPPALDRQVKILENVLVSYLQSFQEGNNNLKIYWAVETYQDVDRTLKTIKDKLGTIPLLKKLKMTTLGPRKPLCINDQINMRDITEFALEERCIQLVQNYNTNTRRNNQEMPTCPFYSNTMNNPQPFNFIGATDVGEIEDLLRHGRDYHQCPFYLNKRMHPDANIVVLPVEYLLSPIHRQENEIDLKEAIIIIDQGYNLEMQCFQTGSIIITWEDLRRGQSALRSIISHGDLDAQLLNIFNSLVDPLQSLSDWINENAQRRVKRQPILEELSTWEVRIRDAELICNVIYSLPQTPDVPNLRYRELQSLKQFFIVLSAVLDNRNNYDLRVKGVPVNGESIPSLLMICGNSEVILNQVEKDAKTLIVGGDCLSPLSPFETGLGVEFHEKIQISYLPDDPIKFRYFVGFCEKGPTGVPFALNNASRGDEEIMLEVIKSIFELSKVIPNGLVILFHSRVYFEMEFMDFLRRNEEATAIMEEIGRVKYFVNELTLTAETEEAEIEMFKQISKEKTGGFKGAILFADARGPLFNKFDLKGKEIRGIVHVSALYGSWHDDNYIAGRRRFFELSGKPYQKQDNHYWYECEAFRMTNQAIGKCVRDKDDWGVVIVLDSRMPKKSHKFKDYLPAWIRNLDLMKPFEFSEMIESVQKFVDGQSD